MNKKILVIISMLALVFVLTSCTKMEVEIAGKTFDASKVYTIAISQSAEKNALASIRKGLVIGMKDLGFVEDVNLKYIYENAKGNTNYAGQIADVYKDNKDIDAIVTIGDIATLAVKDRITDKPIVFAGVGNAERLGLSDENNTSLIQNMTGVIDSHLIEERLSFIAANHTDVKKLGIIYSADNEMSKFDIDYFKFYGTAHDIDIYTVSVKSAEDIDKALDNILPKIDAIALLNDYMIDDVAGRVIERTKADGKIVFGDSEEHVEAGAIVATTRDYQLVGKKAAEMLVSIIKEGMKADDLKVETVDFMVN